MEETIRNISEDITYRAYILYWNEQNSEYLVPNTVLLSIFLLIGLPGNLAVIFVYQFRLNKKTDGRYFIVPLALTDTAALLITGAFNLTQNSKSVIFPGFGACQLLTYLCYVLTCISLYLLIIIAIQRYLKICRPFGRQMNLVWKRCSVLICALTTAILFIPVLFYCGLVEIRNPNLGNVTGYQCNKLPGSTTSLTLLRIHQGFGVLGSIGNVITVTVLYILVTKVIIRQTRQIKKVETKVEILSVTTSCTLDTNSSLDTTTRSTDAPNIHPTNPARSKSAYRISFMFMTISIVGFLAYLPSWIFILIETNNPEFWKNLPYVSYHICLALRRMYMVNHLCNPYIYGVFDKDFRDEVMKLFGKKV
ncbi:thyrotropin-releasing hormone receptor [Mytilus galloprovincialis]|uniref:Thyrotropin-releasing hormone receptor n=1 Tax=Mytilus galloprovincialis TaxID=29158 RepID=A0A8B6H3I6_MYTGA|nr:thyrotropin-releasing hormone receptor [Mytilus galloprovincialis]